MYDMGTDELIRRLAVALAMGLLIGLERGWRTREEHEGERAAGLRTHGLAALLGGVWGAIAWQFSRDGGAIALGVAFLVFGALAGLFRYRETSHNQTFGATTLIGVLIAFSLGAFAVVGDPVAAASAAVATTILLALKTLLHHWVERLTWPELRSALVLLAMSFILLPVLPDEAVDRWGAVNPHQLWLMTVLIGVISFAGYVAVKLVGYRRGLVVAGMAGGLASSTATTAAMSRLANDHPEHVDALAAGAIFSNAIMGPRVLAILSVINAEFGLRLAAPMLVIGLVYLAAGGLMMWRGAANGGEEQPMTIRNPLDLPAVLKFGALLAAVMVLSKLVTKFAGSSGAYVLALLSGVADVDAIALTMASHGLAEIGAHAAALAVLLAVVSNTVAKSAMSFAMGGRPMGWRFSLASALALAAGLAALFFIPAPSL